MRKWNNWFLCTVAAIAATFGGCCVLLGFGDAPTLAPIEGVAFAMFRVVMYVIVLSAADKIGYVYTTVKRWDEAQQKAREARQPKQRQ